MPSKYHFEEPDIPQVVHPAHRFTLHFEAPQRLGEGEVPQGPAMLYEDFGRMEYEDLENMEYEGSFVPITMLYNNFVIFMEYNNTTTKMEYNP